MKEMFPGIERRITLRLLAYWERLRMGRDIPLRDDIDPEEISDLWNSCFLIHINDFSKQDYRFAFIGDEVVQAYRHELSRDEAAAMVSPDVLKLSKYIGATVASRRPVIDEGETRTSLGQLVRYRQCFLPLGTDSRVDGVLGGMRYKIFP